MTSDDVTHTPENEELPAICGAIKLVPIGFTHFAASPGITKAAMVCVREPGHPELDADSSLHLCGTFAWAVGPGDDDRLLSPGSGEAAS